MINYLSAEFTKLFKRKNFYLGMFLIIILSILNITISIIMYNSNNISPTTSQIQEIVMRFFANKFIAVIMIYIVTTFIADTSYNTIKNAIAIGYSRTTVYFSKLIVGTAAIALLASASMISTLSYYAIWLGELFEISILWNSLLRYVLCMLIFISLYVISITLYYLLSNQLFYTMLYFILMLVITELIEVSTSYNDISFTLSKILLTHHLNTLIYSAQLTTSDYLMIVLSAIGYCVTIIPLGAVILSRKDIK